MVMAGEAPVNETCETKGKKKRKITHLVVLTRNRMSCTSAIRRINTTPCNVVVFASDVLLWYVLASPHNTTRHDTTQHDTMHDTQHTITQHTRYNTRKYIHNAEHTTHKTRTHTPDGTTKPTSSAYKERAKGSTTRNAEQTQNTNTTQHTMQYNTTQQNTTQHTTKLDKGKTGFSTITCDKHRSKRLAPRKLPG